MTTLSKAFFFLSRDLMSESVNHTYSEHNCDHSVFTGPVKIIGSNYGIPEYGNVALNLPSIIDTETIDEAGNKIISENTSIIFRGGTDGARIKFHTCGDYEGNTYLEIATCDNASEAIYVRQYNYKNPNETNGSCYNIITHSLTLLDYDGTTSIPKALYIYDSSTGKHIDVSATLKAIAGDKIVYKEE